MNDCGSIVGYAIIWQIFLFFTDLLQYKIEVPIVKKGSETMFIRRRAVKIWQVLLIIAIVLVVFMIMALVQGNYNLPTPDTPFSQEVLEKIKGISGSKDDLYVTAFTFPEGDEEEDRFVISLSGAGESGRRQTWNVIYYNKDGQMPYRMEKTEAVLDLPEGAKPLEELFPQLGAFWENRKAVFALFPDQKKAAKGETDAQLDVCDRFGEEDLLLKRESVSALATESESSSSIASAAGKQESTETRIALDKEVEGIMTVTISDDKVTEKEYQPGDCTEESFVLYRSGVQDGIRTETLLAVVNVEEK